LRQVPAGLPELRLTPLTLRGNASSFELKARADVPYVELRLIWLKTEQYQSYQAVVRRIRDGEAYTISDLHAAEDPENHIRLLLPAHLLTRGTYQIQLSGITLSGRTEATEECQFTVVG
jgi:hypothetical protein